MTRRTAGIGMAFGVAAIFVSAHVNPSVRLVYNPSSSAPRGWYRVLPATHLGVGQYVVVRLPRDTAVFAASRGYLPRSVPVLKQIAAIGGQRVCIRKVVVYVDDVPIARTLGVDGMGRPLHAWAHCRRLIDGELFLLNTSNAASFDSRYFGPVDVSFVIGQAVALSTSDRR